jgi:thiol-disulfide isomerase/thioredoxin
MLLWGQVLYHTLLAPTRIIKGRHKKPMKRSIVTLVLFFALAIVFSSQNGCSSNQPNTANNANNTNAAAPNKNAQSDEPTKASIYPPLPAGLAETSFELLDGNKFKVSDKKGKVVLLNIWGTWCGPCRAEMPTLMALQEQYRDKGFEVIGLNIGDGGGIPESIDDINRFVAQMRLNYTIARSSNASTREFYGVTKAQVVPQSVLVDRDGRLRGVFVGGGSNIYLSMQETIGKVMAE